MQHTNWVDGVKHGMEVWYKKNGHPKNIFTWVNGREIEQDY
jgi:hypothetical protein